MKRPDSDDAHGAQHHQSRADLPELDKRRQRTLADAVGKTARVQLRKAEKPTDPLRIFQGSFIETLCADYGGASNLEAIANLATSVTAATRNFSMSADTSKGVGTPPIDNAEP